MKTTRIRLLIAITAVWSAALGFSITVQGQNASAPATVWEKVYTEGQAKRGETLYRDNCSACHGEDLLGGGLTPALTGTDFTFHWTGKSVGELFARIRGLMPPDDPAGLPVETYRDVTAFLLKSNGYPAGDKELSDELEHLKQIAITAKP